MILMETNMSPIILQKQLSVTTFMNFILNSSHEIILFNHIIYIYIYIYIIKITVHKSPLAPIKYFKHLNLTLLGTFGQVFILLSSTHQKP